jgi:hypothetical protein
MRGVPAAFLVAAALAASPALGSTACENSCIPGVNLPWMCECADLPDNDQTASGGSCAPGGQNDPVEFTAAPPPPDQGKDKPAAPNPPDRPEPPSPPDKPEPPVIPDLPPDPPPTQTEPPYEPSFACD